MEMQRRGGRGTHWKLNMASAKCVIQQIRYISTTKLCCGKRNFRKFLLYSKRGSRMFKEAQASNPDPNFPVIDRGARDVGYTVDGSFVPIQEMVPELIVPELTGFKLKPYVSYRAPEVVQSEFSAQDLFNAVYSQKIVDDYKAGKLDADGNPIQPSPEENLEPKEAVLRARKTGSDIFGPSKV